MYIFNVSEHHKNNYNYCLRQWSGIPEEYYEAVFQRLYQLGSSRQTEGFGLGLPIVKAIVDLHYGSISLSSSNPGLTISITLEIASIRNYGQWRTKNSLKCWHE